MKKLSDIALILRRKLGIEENYTEGKQNEKDTRKGTITKQISCQEDGVIFAYSSRKEDFLYPVHSFPSNISQNSVLNNRLVPHPESCSSSFVDDDYQSFGQYKFTMHDSLDSFTSYDDQNNFDFQVWKRIMGPLKILEQIFKNEKERVFYIPHESTVSVTGKVYRTTIPAELIDTTVMNYCSRNLTRVAYSSFSYLKCLTSLQLCCNSLVEVPQEICLLRRLETLSLSNNKLKSLPSTIGYLVNLEYLYLDRNELSTLPRSISGLKKLKVLSLAANQFTEIPQSVMLLNRLVTFECDRNPNLLAVPAEIIRFSQLARFHVEECPKLLKESQYIEFGKDRTNKGVPSLLECSARSLIRHRKSVLFSIPRHIKLFLSRCEECSFCSGPMIDSQVIHSRTIKRIDRSFPIIEKICCAHWKKEEERLTAIFSPYPPTTPPLLLSTDRRDRSGSLSPFNQFDPERSARGYKILQKFKTEELHQVLVPLSLIVDWPQYPTSKQL